jgi:hypothetical protein
VQNVHYVGTYTQPAVSPLPITGQYFHVTNIVCQLRQSAQRIKAAVWADRPIRGRDKWQVSDKYDTNKLGMDICRGSTSTVSWQVFWMFMGGNEQQRGTNACCHAVSSLALPSPNVQPVSRDLNCYIMSRRFCYVIATSLHYASMRTVGLPPIVMDPCARWPPFDARPVHNCSLFAAVFGPALEVHQAPFAPGYLELFAQAKGPQRKSHLHLLLRLRMSGAIPPLLHNSSWRRA